MYELHWGLPTPPPLNSHNVVHTPMDVKNKHFQSLIIFVQAKPSNYLYSFFFLKEKLNLHSILAKRINMTKSKNLHYLFHLFKLKCFGSPSQLSFCANVNNDMMEKKKENIIIKLHHFY